MIYRLSSKFEEMYYSAEWSTPPDGVEPGGAAAREYRFHFEEQPLEPPWPDCRIFKAPILPEWRMNRDLIIEKNTKKALELPDFIVWQGGIYVSDVVKEIIEEVDDFGHQFWPVPVFTTLKNRKAREPADRIYYRMNMRRYVNIEAAETTPDKLDFDPCKQRLENKIVAAIQHSQQLRGQIETLPIWQHYGITETTKGWLIHDDVLFINATLMNELKQAGISGISEYSTYQGTTQEMVAHV